MKVRVIGILMKKRCIYANLPEILEDSAIYALLHRSLQPPPDLPASNELIPPSLTLHS